jgi:hypothetical protein
VPCQDGKVDKSFKQIAATTKEALQTQKALQSLAESQGSELPQIISNLDPNGSKPSAGSSVPMPDAKDITAEFLAPTQQSEDYTDSSIVVYKGILRRLGGMRPRANTIAVLAGSDKHAVSVVVSEDLATVVKSKHVLDYWKQLEHEPLGLAIFGAISDPGQYADSILSLPTSQKTLLLISISDGISNLAWLAERQGDATSGLVWTQVRVGCQSSTRKKHDKIRFVHADRIGVTFDDEVRDLPKDWFL